MRVAVAGSTGTVGTALVGALRDRGDEVVRMVRPTTDASGISWHPSAGTIDAAALEGFDAVVNLAGRSIGEKRWTTEEKRLLWASRVDSTRLLAGALAGLDAPPRRLVNASAVGYYGDGGEEILTEESPPGEGFLAELCMAWEGATSAASDAGIGVARIRSGIVLDTDGGALGRLLTPLGPKWLSPYRWGMAGPVGRGRQWWSWISLDDEVGAILHLLDNQVTGPVNLTAPEPVRHKEFIKALGRVLGRPTVIPIPPFVVRLVVGSELADALVLQGQRTVPTVLQSTGFEFGVVDVEEGLRSALEA